MDTVSRSRFYRRLQKTAKFLAEKRYEKEQRFKVYEFTKFHSLFPHTYPNLLASEYGIYSDGFKPDNQTRISHYAFLKGYITGASIDLCQAGEQDSETYNSLLSMSYDDDWIQHHLTF